MTITTSIYAVSTISVSALRRSNPSKILEDARGNAVAVLNHNKPEAYLLTAKAYEKLLDAVDDLALLKTIEKRRGGKTVRVNIEAL